MGVFRVVLIIQMVPHSATGLIYWMTVFQYEEVEGSTMTRDFPKHPTRHLTPLDS